MKKVDKSAMIRGAILAMQGNNNTKTELFKYLDNLEDDELFLKALQNEGVDNWEGYEAAQERYKEYKEEV